MQDDVEQFLVPESIPMVTEYDVHGMPTTHAESAVAKISEVDGIKSFYLKHNGDGLYDPCSMFASGSGSLGAKRNGLEVWRYRKVDEEAYGMYCQFLKTKSANYLQKAQRIIQTENI